MFLSWGVWENKQGQCAPGLSGFHEGGLRVLLLFSLSFYSKQVLGGVEHVCDSGGHPTLSLLTKAPGEVVREIATIAAECSGVEIDSLARESREHLN